MFLIPARVLAVGLLAAATSLTGAAVPSSSAEGRARAASRPVSALLAPEGHCAGADAAGAPRDVQLRAMLCLHHFARARQGVAPLTTSRALGASATSKARDIVRCREYSHTACGKQPITYFRKAGVRCPLARTETCSENLAWAWQRQTTPREEMRSWLVSRSHREGLLDGRMRRVGFSYSCGRVDGEPGVCIWVAHFAVAAK